MLGLRFSHLVHAAVASGAVALPGCTGGGGDTETDTETDTDGTGTTTEDPTTAGPTTLNPTTPTTDPPPPVDATPPALAAVEFLDPQILRLTFTEPIAAVDDVNPLRFRMSVGIYQPQYYYSYARTSYVNPNQWNSERVCGEKCYEGPYDYYCYYQCYYGDILPIEAQDVLADAYDPASVVLLLKHPIMPQVCLVSNNLGGPEGTRGGLLLHYAAGGAAQITDFAGIPLASIGAEWVKSDSDYYTRQNVNFPDMNPFLPIPCPFG